MVEENRPKDRGMHADERITPGPIRRIGSAIGLAVLVVAMGTLGALTIAVSLFAALRFAAAALS